MGMKKFLVTALLIITAVFALTATGFAAADVAYADDNGFVYICVTPSDESLVANETPRNTEIPVVNIGKGETAFFLIESYYYKVKENAVLTDYYNLYYGSENSGLSVNKNLVSEYIVNTLPANANGVEAPSVHVTIKDGKSVTAGSNTVIDSASSDYTLRFLGFNANADVYFSAQKGDSGVLFGTAPLDSFNAFTVPYHPVSEARRAELNTTPPVVDGNGDLTAGTPSKTLRIILIIGIAVPALLIILLIFKPSSDTKRGYDKRAMKHDSKQNIDYDRERNYNADRDRYDRGYRDYERRDYPERRDYDRGYDNHGYDNRGYDDRGGYPRDYDRDRYDR